MSPPQSFTDPNTATDTRTRWSESHTGCCRARGPRPLGPSPSVCPRDHRARRTRGWARDAVGSHLLSWVLPGAAHRDCSLVLPGVLCGSRRAVRRGAHSRRLTQEGERGWPASEGGREQGWPRQACGQRPRDGQQSRPPAGREASSWGQNVQGSATAWWLKTTEKSGGSGGQMSTVKVPAGHTRPDQGEPGPASGRASLAVARHPVSASTVTPLFSNALCGFGPLRSSRIRFSSQSP